MDVPLPIAIPRGPTPGPPVGGAPAAPGGIEDADALVRSAYEAFRGEVRGVLLARLRDPAVADDLVHEAFLRLHVEVAAGRAPLRPRAWLHRVALNLLASRARHATVEARERASWQRLETYRSAEELAERRESADDLRAALTALRAVERDVLLLAAAGLSGPEIGASLGRSPAATRTLLCRARRRLRLVLERREAAAAVGSA